MKILIIDNYDSFTYNLAEYIKQAGASVMVALNDAICLEDIEKMEVDGIIFSPGPGRPEKKEDIGICDDILRYFSGRIPVLGVCLGHQLLGLHYGATVLQTNPVHGEASVVEIVTKSPLFTGLPPEFDAMRYHSLIISPENLPKDLYIVAQTKNKTIMAVQHINLPLFGVQFHPESVGTPVGLKIIKNFVRICKKYGKFQKIL